MLHGTWIARKLTGGAVIKNLSVNAGDSVSIPGLGRSPGVGNGNPPQYSCLENTIDRGTWHGVTNSWTWLSPHAHTHRAKKEKSFKERKKVKLLSCIWLFATPGTVDYKAPPSMEFSRQEYWSGLPLPSPGDLPNPGIEPGSPTLQADALPSELPRKPRILKPRPKLISIFSKWKHQFSKRQALVKWFFNIVLSLSLFFLT